MPCMCLPTGQSEQSLLSRSARSLSSIDTVTSGHRSDRFRSEQSHPDIAIRMTPLGTDRSFQLLQPRCAALVALNALVGRSPALSGQLSKRQRAVGGRHGFGLRKAGRDACASLSPPETPAPISTPAALDRLAAERYLQAGQRRGSDRPANVPTPTCSTGKGSVAPTDTRSTTALRSGTPTHSTWDPDPAAAARTR